MGTEFQKDNKTQIVIFLNKKGKNYNILRG